VTPWLAFLTSALVALGGHALGWLTRGAAAAATVVGTCALAGTGPAGMGLLGMFFVSGSALTARSSARGGTASARRTARQVWANGWTAALGGLLTPLAPALGWATITGGLAAAQADTWATEIGRLARRPPVLITTGRPVPVGTSGAVSALGTMAGVAGGVLLAALGWALGVPGSAAAAAAASGLAGMLVDSLLGATLQGVYRCPRCAVETEAPTHGCGAAATLVRGRRWMTNDAVNLAATGIGAALTVALAAAVR
jgi:uncharacterized protein (TIGR00297 family)